MEALLGEGSQAGRGVRTHAQHSGSTGWTLHQQNCGAWCFGEGTRRSRRWLDGWKVPPEALQFLPTEGLGGPGDEWLRKGSGHDLQRKRSKN